MWYELRNRPRSTWSLYGSVVRASERGIRRSEARFLMGTDNFFFVPRSWQDEKNIFLYFFRLSSSKLTISLISIYWPISLTNRTKNIWLTTIHLTLMMISAQVVKTSVTTTDNSPSQEYTNPDDQTTPSYFTPGSNHLLYFNNCCYMQLPITNRLKEISLFKWVDTSFTLTDLHKRFLSVSWLAFVKIFLCCW